MEIGFIIAVVVIAALAFDFTNGFHDTANSMATTVATGALRPRVAVGLAAVLNVVGAFISLKVAATIAKGIVDQGSVTLPIIFGGLVGAIIWNLATWYLGLPSSSSHALIGGVVGATALVAGWHAVNGQGIVAKVLIPAVLSPILACVVAIVATRIARETTRRERPSEVTRGYRYGQVASSSLLALAHGTNDAQKTMGVIALALVANGNLTDGANPPDWVIASAAAAIGLGTWFGGWRIMRTLGKRVTELNPAQGFSANTAAATVILAASNAGFPLSTTHVASGSVVGAGVGAGKRVDWGVAGRMTIAWGLTLPGAGLIGALAAWVAADGIGGDAGVVVVAVVAVLAAAGFWLAQRRDRVGVEEFADARGDEVLVDSQHEAPRPEKKPKSKKRKPAKV